MDKSRIVGIRRRTSEHMIAKSISIKGAGCKSGGCASKAVSLIAGGLPYVSESRLRMKRFIQIVRQKSAAGIVAASAARLDERQAAEQPASAGLWRGGEE